MKGVSFAVAAWLLASTAQARPSLEQMLAGLGVTEQNLRSEPPAGSAPLPFFRPDTFDNSMAVSVRDVAERWVMPSLWSGRVAINEPPRADQLTVLSVRHAALEASAPEYSCGCSMIAGFGTIICDASFLREFTRAIDPGVDPSQVQDAGVASALSAMQAGFRQFLIEWLIGHEVGHFMLKHTSGQLFDSWTYKDGKAIGSDIERQADEYYISRLQQRQDHQFYAWLGLSNVITKLYARAVHDQHGGEDLSQYGVTDGIDPIFSARVPVTVQYWPGTHPPLLVRALNLAELVLDIYPQMVDSTHYFSRIKSRLKLVPGLTANPSCDSVADQPSEEDLASVADQGAFLAARIYASPEAARATLDELSAAIVRLADSPDRARWAVIRDILAIEVAGTMPGAADLAELSARIAQLDQISASHAVWRLRTTSLRIEGVGSDEALSLLLADAARAREGQDETSAKLASLAVLQALASIDQAEVSAETASAELQAVQTLADFAGFTDRLLVVQFLQDRLEHLMAREGLLRQNPSPAVVQVLDELVQFSAATSLLAQEAAFRGETLSYWARFGDREDLQERVIDDERSLGRLLMTLQQPKAATRHYELALDRLGVLAARAAPGENQWRAAGQHLSAMNDLGWALMIDRQFDRATTLLEQAIELRETRLSSFGLAACRPADQDAVEYATTQQNLADALLGAGKLERARDTAQFARLCRSRIGREFQAAESGKTEGLARHALRDDEHATPLLRRYVDLFGKQLDNRAFLDLDPYLGGGVVAGQYVRLRDLLPAWPQAQGSGDGSEPRP